MGWFLRKSLTLGPVRLSLSKSSLGASLGDQGSPDRDWTARSLGARRSQRHPGGQGRARQSVLVHLPRVADWIVALGTLALAVVAALQDRVRAFFYRPTLSASIRTEPPDCQMVPWTRKADGVRIGDALYLRLWITNSGNAPAKLAEVYARHLERQRADGEWERVQTFPPMNLNWSHVSGSHYFQIAPGMGKHCDLGHISDPAIRSQVGADENPALGLRPDQASLAFDQIVKPNHLGHIVGPGHYRLTIVVAAGNAKPVEQTVDINLNGAWHAEEERMLRDGIGVRIRG